MEFGAKRLEPACGVPKKILEGWRVDSQRFRYYTTYGRTLEKLWLRDIWDENSFPLPVFSVQVISDTLLGEAFHTVYRTVIDSPARLRPQASRFQKLL
jgi:hypothetical protein